MTSGVAFSQRCASIDFSALFAKSCDPWASWKSFSYLKKSAETHILLVDDEVRYRVAVKRIFLQDSNACSYFRLESVYRRLQRSSAWDIAISQGVIDVVMPVYQEFDVQTLRECEPCVHSYFLLAAFHAVVALHEDGVVHRNLTPEHVMLDDALAPRFVGFGRAALLQQNEQLSTSPESLEYDQLIDFSQVAKSLCWHFYGLRSYGEIESHLRESPGAKACQLALNLHMGRIYKTNLLAELECLRDDLRQLDFEPQFELEPVMAYFQRYYAAKTVFRPSQLNALALTDSDRAEAARFAESLLPEFQEREALKCSVQAFLQGFQAREESARMLDYVGLLVRK